MNDIDVTSASGIILTPAATDVSCNGGANGTASVVSIGGTPPYSYSLVSFRWNTCECKRTVRRKLYCNCN
ncbi:MAG: SprB repeat-containing protein [Bacteroidetes bacterium]|nr:SprB repeat-containing protein [Bacteroidota bacterium]